MQSGPSAASTKSQLNRSIHNRAPTPNRRVRTHVSARLATVAAMQTPQGTPVKDHTNHFTKKKLTPVAENR